MGCCTSKPCMPKWCCCKKNNNTARNVDEPDNGPAGEGGVTIQMNELTEENEDEDSINEEVTFGVVLLPEQSKQQPSRSNHVTNGNNDTNSERADRKSPGNNKSKAPSHSNGSLHATPPLSKESTSSQYQFFKLLDEKIEMGPDYDATCERERKLEWERMNTLIRNWETCSRSSSQTSTPKKRTSMTRPAAQPAAAAAKQPNTALEHSTQSPQPFRHQQIISAGIADLPRGAAHQLNRIESPHMQHIQSQHPSSTIVTGIPAAGRYWPPMELGFNNFQEIYDYENPIKNQRIAPSINQTATIIHQTYEVIGAHTPTPALLRTGVGNATSSAMSNQLFQFGPRHSGAGSAVVPNSVREYHQEMYTGSHNAAPFVGPVSRQQIAIFDQNGAPPKTRCVLVPAPQPPRHINPNKKYDTYSYRQPLGSNVNVAPPLPPINASTQLKFSTLVSQGSPLQQKQQPQPYGNGEAKFVKKMVLPTETQVNKPSKEQLKHQQLVYGEVHQQPNQKANSAATQQIQENQQQWQLQSNGLVSLAGSSASSAMPGPSGSSSTNIRNFQSTVHIPMKAVVPEIRKPQNKIQKDHMDKKKMN